MDHLLSDSPLHKLKNTYLRIKNYLLTTKSHLESFSDLLHGSYSDFTTRIQNIASKNITEIYQPHLTLIRSIIVHENLIITASDDKKITIRDMKKYTILHELEGHLDWISNLVILTNSRFASCSADKTIKIWDLTTFQCIHTLHGHSNWARCLVELSSNNVLSASKDNCLLLWNLNQKGKSILKPFKRIKLNFSYNGIYCMLLRSLDEFIVAGDIISIYQCNNLKRIKNLCPKSFVSDIKFMVDNKDLLLSCSFEKAVKLWNILSGECIKKFNCNVPWINGMLALTGDLFVIVGGFGISFWSISMNKKIRTIHTKYKEIALVKINYNDFICGGYNNLLRIKY